MGITVIPNLLLEPVQATTAGPPSKTLAEIALTGKYYRHPDSTFISYPLVVQEPLGTINKPLNIAIVGAGAAGIAALYELSNLAGSSENIRVTIYESDPDHFANTVVPTSLKIHGLKAGRVSAAVSYSDEVGTDGVDHTVYEIGAMRFPEIAGLMWHYASILYGDDEVVDPFPNPGRVPTELVHGDRVDRFGNGVWLDENSPTKQVVALVRSGLVGESDKDKGNTSLFPIGGKDPAKIIVQLKSKDTTHDELVVINEQWKAFASKYDKLTLESAVREIIELGLASLPIVPGLQTDADKVNYYVELFGTVGFGTGGFRSVYNMALIEMMRLLLWDYSNEYVLPVAANVHFINDFYKAALQKNPNVQVKLARVGDVCHLDENAAGSAMVVYYDVNPDGTEGSQPQIGIHDYVILSTTPRQTSYMICKLGFNNIQQRATLGDYKRPLSPEDYQGYVRPALVLSTDSEAPNSKLYSAIGRIHMVSSSKVFATMKIKDFDDYAPEFKDQGTIKAIVSDCGLGSCYVVPSTIMDKASAEKFKDYYSFLISYAWEDDTKRLQHNFGTYPLNTENTELMMNVVINRTVRYVTDPEKQQITSWWFGDALSKGNLEDPLSYDWTTFNSSGAFKLDNTGDHFNSHLLFRYHTHALNPALKNRFFLANDSYSHLGGWIEGAFMSAVNAVCGLIVAANDGDVNSLSAGARVVVNSFEKVAA